MKMKVYITPSIKIVNIVSTNHMLQASTTDRYVTPDLSLSRESNGGWDDDEEEEDTGGWFK